MCMMEQVLRNVTINADTGVYVATCATLSGVIASNSTPVPFQDSTIRAERPLCTEKCTAFQYITYLLVGLPLVYKSL